MGKKTLLTLAMLSAMALVAVAPAFAQSQERVEANIPFAFNVGSTSFPAGHYEVRPVLTETLVIQNEATEQAAMALTTSASPKPISGNAEATLVFHKYGDRCFLSEIRTSDNAQALSASKLEREAAKEASEIAGNTPSRDVYVAAFTH
ncbi:MAG TPA: hypothetical protein VMT20_10785 [Terriglobia bacterium]|nr:hypothetical protein [Terriglobia bacterium]